MDLPCETIKLVQKIQNMPMEVLIRFIYDYLW